MPTSESNGFITRDELVRRLAQVSHASWLRQKVRDQGADPTSLPPDVTDHDLERAEDTVAALEDLGVLCGIEGRAGSVPPDGSTSV